MIGRVLKLGAVSVLALTLVLGGLVAAGVLGVPSAGIADNAWGDVDDERIEVVTTAWLDNPNPGLEPDELVVEYDLSMNDHQLASGESDQLAAPRGTHTTEIRTDILRADLPAWWASHIEGDEVSDLEATVRADVAVGPLSGSPTYTHEHEIETDLASMIAEAMAEMEGSHSLSPVASGVGVDPLEPTVEIRDTEAVWGAVDENRTELFLTYDIHNPNAYPLPTPAFTGEFEFNDRTLAAWGANDVDLLENSFDTVIPPQATEERTFVLDLDNDDVVDWFASHVDREEVTDAEMRAQLAMSVNGETVTIPDADAAIHCEYDLRTSIFVEQDGGMDQERCSVVTWATPDQSTFEDLGATVTLESGDIEDGLTDANGDESDSDGDGPDSDADDEAAADTDDDGADVDTDDDGTDVDTDDDGTDEAAADDDSSDDGILDPLAW